MPFTFPAGFLKSSTFSQSKRNNNVDNVNKTNNSVNDNLDMGKNQLAYLPLNVIPPLVRRVCSFDNSTDSKNDRQNSNSGNIKITNRKGWRTIFRMITKWNDDDNDNDDIKNKNNNNSNNNNNVENNGGLKGVITTGNLNKCGDGSIIMRSRDFVAERQKNSFIHHGNTHDFYIMTKNDSVSLTDGNLKSRSSPYFNSVNSDKSKRGVISSSLFEECAKTPRHFAKEPEVLGKVGRFTIVREREDFDTTYFDQCHCQQKPCRFSTNGCSVGTHPVLPPELLKESDHHSSRPLQQQIAHQQGQMQMAYSFSNKNDSWSSTKYRAYPCSNKNDSWSSTNSRAYSCSNKNDSSCSSTQSRYSFYSNNVTTNSSRSSLPSLQKYTNNTNGACPKATVPTVPISPNSNSVSASHVALPHSSSSPNLVHLNQRSKIESVQNKDTSKSRSNMNIIVVGNSGKYPNPQCTIEKPKKFSINMKKIEEQQRSLSMPSTFNPSTPPTPPLNLISSTPTTPTTPTIPSKFSTSPYHHPNEPHTTINSHSGRKFEVEWKITAKSSSTGSTSSSSSSSDTAYSPPSTIGSAISMASSPDKNHTINSLSRRCSTLSSKCGRKFEVTVLSSSGSSNYLLNASPHSTIGSVNSVAVDTNTEQTKC